MRTFIDIITEPPSTGQPNLLLELDQYLTEIGRWGKTLGAAALGLTALAGGMHSAHAQPAPSAMADSGQLPSAAKTSEANYVKLLRAYQAHKDIWSSLSNDDQQQYMAAVSSAPPTPEEHAAYQNYVRTTVPVSAGRNLMSADDF